MEVGSTGLWTLPTDELAAIQAEAPTAGDDFYANRQWSIRRVGADQAWAAGFTGSHETVVAILDTGIDDGHPDLAPNVVYRTCMQLSGPCGADHLTNEHGTMVAGVVAAAFGGGRAVGVGPNLGLASYQVFEDAGGAHDAVLWWAILDAADSDQGFEVINMSLGGYGNFAEHHELSAAAWTAWNRVIGYAIRQGVTVVASAGNDAISTNGAVFHIPGDIPGTINVAGTAIRPDPIFPQTDGYDIQAFYSNSGASVNLVAPGGDWGPEGDLLKVLPSGYLGMHYGVATTYWHDQYAFAVGNSFATSHVAGAAGLILDENPGLSPRQVAAILTRTAAKMGSRQIFGHGMLDVPRALEAASKQEGDAGPPVY